MFECYKYNFSLEKFGSQTVLHIYSSNERNLAKFVFVMCCGSPASTSKTPPSPITSSIYMKRNRHKHKRVRRSSHIQLLEETVL